jgi:DnaJ-domain-containing protein 1
MEKENQDGSNNKVNNLNSNEGIPSQVEKAIEFDVKKLLEEIQSEQQNPMTSSVQLKRLLSTNFVSPYEVLMLNTEATDEEIKKQYRQLSLLVHPDKCNDDKAPDAFHGKIKFKFKIFNLLLVF